MSELNSDPSEEYIQSRLDLSETHTPQPRKLYTFKEIGDLHRALAPFIDIPALRRLAAEQQDIYKALRIDQPPHELRVLLETLSAILYPLPREQIRSPATIAALLMLEMAYLDQEEMRTVLLDTKNRLQGIVTVYKGSVNVVSTRIGELYKEALRRNSAGIILVHNHPSGDPEPSPEDILITQQAVGAGKILDVECLDHVIIGQGRWVSMKKRKLGFPSA